ncbi:MAG: PilX N-terminal domain-containing pilus assembly protein [Burkholderiales bacterium]
MNHHLASQRGAAALIVTLLLFLAMALAALGVNRHLVFEQRASANQARATQAFEAAEAGLQWAQALLDSPQRIGPDCKPSAEPAATTFRDRLLTLDRSTGAIGTTGSLPACVRGAGGWSCSCPAAGAAALSAPGGTIPAPAFALQFQPTARAGTVRVVASGCTSLAGACLLGAATSADASARVEVTLALFAGLRTAPVDALTTRDAANQTTDQFFAASFGLPRSTWQNQPVVARVACGNDCGSAIGAAIAAGFALIAVDGDLSLTGPIALGSVNEPVVIAASGAVRLDGAVAIVGALYGASMTLADAGPNVQGAVITESPYAGPAAPEFHRDAAVLATLAHRTGSFTRVSGSWRDF